MKKILKTIILLILVVPFIVKADMGMPLTEEYEVEVVKDEIKYYDYSEKPQGTIKKGTKLTVIYAYEGKDDEYLNVEYGNTWVFVKSSDVVAKGELGVDAEGVGPAGIGNKIKISKEIEVKKGPSESFETVGTLKAGTYTFDYTFISPLYIYVNTKDVKGWIKGENNDLLYGGLTYIVPIEKETTCGTIPANYQFKDVWTEAFYHSTIKFNYKDCEIELNTLSDITAIEPVRTLYKAKKEIPLYETIGNEKKQVEEKIPEGKEYILTSREFTKNQFKQNPEFYYYIEYNKKFYWIESSDLINNSEKIGEYEEPVEKEEKEEDKKEEKKIDTKTIVIICIVAGTSLALGALVTLILVNKKGKKDEKVTE